MVLNDKAVIGTNAIGTPAQSNKFGKITLDIDDVVFILVSIKIEIPIIIKPAAVKILGSIYLEIAPTVNNPTKQTIARGNIVKPDIDGL